jgi:hypothetical protein
MKVLRPRWRPLGSSIDCRRRFGHPGIHVLGTAGLARPVDARQVAKLDRDLLAARDKLGFNITDDNVDCAR